MSSKIHITISLRTKISQRIRYFSLINHNLTKEIYRVRNHIAEMIIVNNKLVIGVAQL
jgi:hypothetical protein